MVPKVPTTPQSFKLLHTPVMGRLGAERLTAQRRVYHKRKGICENNRGENVTMWCVGKIVATGCVCLWSMCVCVVGVCMCVFGSVSVSGR